MDGNSSLDDILNDEPTEELAVETPETPVADRDENGRFAKKGEPEGASPAPVADEYGKAEHAATKGERERRQAAEERARTLEAQLQALQNPPAPPPSIWDDEAAAREHDRNQSVEEAVKMATFNSRLDMSEMMVRQANPDFEEAKAEFLALAEENPQLRQQALSDPHPWNKAYQIAKNHRSMQELGATDMETLKAKIREELVAEMGQPARPQGLPPTLSMERNMGGRGGPAWSGPASLDDLLR